MLRVFLMVGFRNFTWGKKHENPRLKSQKCLSLFFNLLYTTDLSSYPFLWSTWWWPWRLRICLRNLYAGLLTKAWWLHDIGLECLIEQKLKDLCLQVSKHIKLILLLNYLIDRTSCPKPKISFSNMFIDSFPPKLFRCRRINSWESSSTCPINLQACGNHSATAIRVVFAGLHCQFVWKIDS